MPHFDFLRTPFYAVASLIFAASTALAADVPFQGNPNKALAIPCDQIGATASADYHGNGLSVAGTPSGARLECAFQRMCGEATCEGLWLVSTVTNQPSDRFQVVASAVGGHALAPQGTVTVSSQTVRFARAGLVEEYSVSVDGVQQDFIVTERPAGDGRLKVRLSVTAARAEPTAYGAQLVLETSGRKIAYSRLQATDAKGKVLPSRIEVEPSSALRKSPSEFAIVVEDAGAAYPVRIDPTFSDANWLPLGSGMNGDVLALVASRGTLFAGGMFTMAGGQAANGIAQWNGTSWSALGAGVGGSAPYVCALAVSGTNLYVGGDFTTAGGTNVNGIAQWNGTSWSSLGLGMGTGNQYSPSVFALAVSGNTLYAGGWFATAGGNAANNIAEWNGSSWTPLGSGVNSTVWALAISENTLYAGGQFTMAGGKVAVNIAQWSGWNWAPLGSGVNSEVVALAVSGSSLYAGGGFTVAGGTTVNGIAQWNGSGWSPLGSGMGGQYLDVDALAVSGNTLYAGGWFATAGGDVANGIAQWNGNSWSPLGSGMSGSIPYVDALTVSGGALYAGGDFAMAGGKVSANVAEATISAPFILTQPQSTNVLIGGSTVFVVDADGYGQRLFYQWYFGSATPERSAGAMVRITNGFIYGAVVTNGGFGYTVAPKVQFIGGGGSGGAGNAVVSHGIVTAITVTNAGSGYTNLPAVQIDPPNGLLPSQTNATMKLTAITTNDVGIYFVQVSNLCGSVTSDVASLTIAHPPSITIQPQSLHVAQGNTAVFNVNATGTPTPNYQWRMISGTHSNAIAVPVVANGFLVGVKVTNGGTGYLAAPNVQFVGGSGKGAGGCAVVSNCIVSAVIVTNAGSGYTTAPVIKIDAPCAINLPGQTDAMLALWAVTDDDAENYFVVLTNYFGAVTSAVASLTVFLPPQDFLVFRTNNHQVALHFIGTPNYPYILQSVTNLMPPVNWRPVLTNPADANGSWRFSDTNLLRSGQKFYRAVGQ